MARPLKSNNNLMMPDITGPYPTLATSNIYEDGWAGVPQTAPIGAVPDPAAAPAAVPSLYQQAVREKAQQDARIAQIYADIDTHAQSAPTPLQERDFTEPFPTIQRAAPYESPDLTPYSNNVKNAMLPLSLVSLFGGQFGRRVMPQLVSAYATGMQDQQSRFEAERKLAYQMYARSLQEENDATIKGWEGRGENVNRHNIGVRQQNQNARMIWQDEGGRLGAKLKVAQTASTEATDAMAREQSNATRMASRTISTLIESLGRNDFTSNEEIKNRIAYINSYMDAIADAYGLPKSALKLEAEKDLASRMGNSPHMASLEMQAAAARERAEIAAEAQANRLEADLNSRERMKVAELTVRSALDRYSAELSAMNGPNGRIAQFNKYIDFEKMKYNLSYNAKVRNIQNRLVGVRAKYGEIIAARNAFDQFMFQSRNEQDPKEREKWVRRAMEQAQIAKQRIEEYRNDMAAWTRDATAIQVEMPHVDPSLFSPPAAAMPSIPEEVLDIKKLMDIKTDIQVRGSSQSKQRSGGKPLIGASGIVPLPKPDKSATKPKGPVPLGKATPVNDPKATRKFVPPPGVRATGEKVVIQ